MAWAKKSFIPVAHQAWGIWVVHPGVQEYPMSVSLTLFINTVYGDKNRMNFRWFISLFKSFLHKSTVLVPALGRLNPFLHLLGTSLFITHWWERAKESWSKVVGNYCSIQGQRSLPHNCFPTPYGIVLLCLVNTWCYIYCWWECKTVQPLWKLFWQFL